MPPFERARVLGWLGDVGWIEGGGGWNEHFGVGGCRLLTEEVVG